MKSYDVLILGGGAAGLMCAIEAGKRGRRVLLLERNREIGEKIRISGGGRCNFTNRIVTHEQFLSSNPDFSRSALARFTPQDFIAMVEKHGIRYHEKKLGQLFCDGSAQEIITMLGRECIDAGIEILPGCRVEEVGRRDRFFARTDKGEFDAACLVVATGGLSIPKLGATDFGYRIARQFGIDVVPTRPGLVPLTIPSREVSFYSALSGVSAGAEVSCDDVRFQESILFTHRGLSGPAILQISSYLDRGQPIRIDLSPGADLHRFLRERQQTDSTLVTVLAEILPRRLAADWCTRFAPSRPIRHYSLKKLAAIADQLHGWVVQPDGNEGYKKAEVTCGGVDTRELSSKTMEARKVPGLFFIGEVVDVTGHLGGYNFQWAWASGFAAGCGV